MIIKKNSGLPPLLETASAAFVVHMGGHGWRGTVQCGMFLTSAHGWRWVEGHMCSVGELWSHGSEFEAVSRGQGIRCNYFLLLYIMKALKCKPSAQFD